MANLSVVILTNNAEDIISDCLESCKWADEIVVLDCNSTDKSVEICRRYTNNIYSTAPTENSGLLWNKAIERATCDWVFVLESDKRIGPDLRLEIEKVLNQENSVFGYAAATKNYFLGKWIKNCGLYPDWKLYLFRNKKAKFEERMGGILKFCGDTAHFKNAVDHFVYRSLTKDIQKMNVRSEFTALEFMRNKEEFKSYFLFTKPFRMFKKCYFKQKGYKDGTYGFLYSALMAMSRFLVYAKYWELLQQDKNK